MLTLYISFFYNKHITYIINILDLLRIHMVFLHKYIERNMFTSKAEVDL